MVLTNSVVFASLLLEAWASDAKEKGEKEEEIKKSFFENTTNPKSTS